MATETTKKTEQTEPTDEAGTGTTTESEQAAEATADATPSKRGADADEQDAGTDIDDDGHTTDDRVVVVRRGPFATAWSAGAAAVVSAGLGLSSLTGTPLSEMLRDRKQLIGQIESSSQGQSGGGGANQINSLYGAPWHATAAVNGVFALLAVIVGGALLGLVAKRAETASWVKAVALGGLILGVIGLVIAGGMYLDLFAAAPKVPSTPAPQPAQ